MRDLVFSFASLRESFFVIVSLVVTAYQPKGTFERLNELIKVRLSLALFYKQRTKIILQDQISAVHIGHSVYSMHPGCSSREVCHFSSSIASIS